MNSRQLGNQISIELQEGDDYFPTCLKFTCHDPWLFVFRSSRVEAGRLRGSDWQRTCLLKLEAMEAIESLCHVLRKELIKVLPEELRG